MAGNHTTPGLWQKYSHLVNPKLIPAKDIPADYDFDKFAAGRLDAAKDHGISQKSMARLVDPHAFPLMAKTLKGLPPTFLMTCELDTLRDDGILYAQRLKADGVKVTHYHDTKGWHAMITLTKGRFTVDAAVRAMENIVKFIETLPVTQHASVQTGP